MTKKCLIQGCRNQGEPYCSTHMDGVWQDIRQVHMHDRLLFDEARIAFLMQHHPMAPIVVGNDGVVVDGHDRLLAAMRLGWAKVPTRGPLVSSNWYCRNHNTKLRDGICTYTRLDAHNIPQTYHHDPATRLSICTKCGMSIDLNMCEGTSICGNCAKLEWLKSGFCLGGKVPAPKDTVPVWIGADETVLLVPSVPVHLSKRGKVLCLTPRCRVWIALKTADEGGKDRYFCKRHRVASIDKYPFHDREGDAIWITKDLLVIKIKDMGESHLMNSISFIETQAERRSQITGRSAEDILSQHPRYQLLIAEVKQRDACKLCSDGIVSVEWPTVLGVDGNGKSEEFDDISKAPKVTHCTCERGMIRSASAHIVAQAKHAQVTVTLGIVLAILTSFLIGSHMELAHGFIARVVAQLKAMGAL